MTSGRLPAPVPTPYGNLLVQLPIYLSVFIPTGTGQLPLPIPNDPGLTGLLLDFQGMAFHVTNNVFGMTNGTDIGSPLAGRRPVHRRNPAPGLLFRTGEGL